jgi:hypothetical protein
MVVEVGVGHVFKLRKFGTADERRYTPIRSKAIFFRPGFGFIGVYRRSSAVKKETLPRLTNISEKKKSPLTRFCPYRRVSAFIGG